MTKKKSSSEAPRETPLPDNRETLLGVIQQFLGYDRARVICSDGKIRLCRIPGRFKKKVWMRVGNVVLVALWEFQRDERGDIIHRYNSGDVQKLEEKGLLSELKKVLEGLSY